MKNVDIVIIQPGDKREVYQILGDQLSAVEPPYWAAILASNLQRRGWQVAILDAVADNLSPNEVCERVTQYKPLLSVIVVYGSQPSASTQNMPAAGRICAALQQRRTGVVAMAGLHPSALPKQTITEEAVDFVVDGEGFETLHGLLGQCKAGTCRWEHVPGLWYKKDGEIQHTPRAPIEKDLDQLWERAAWELLPMSKYRAHNWHCFEDIEHRAPYASIYTSLGCPYSCSFCCINALFGKPGIRYRKPASVVREIEWLVNNYGVRNLKIIDELFIFNEKHYRPILQAFIDRRLDLNIWAYARIDTIRRDALQMMRKAGIHWLALGIETGSQYVADNVSKRIKIDKVKEVVASIRDAGIRIIANYMFGLPDDDLVTMQATLDLAMDLNCEFANFYCAMPYPGSQLYDIALAEGWTMPAHWGGYSQHSYDTVPLNTRHLSSAQVLDYRDRAFAIYYSNPKYLDMLEKTFGFSVRQHIQNVTAIKLKRRLLEGKI